MSDRSACLCANLLLIFAAFFLFSGCPSAPKQSRVTALEESVLPESAASPLETVQVPPAWDLNVTHDNPDAVLPAEQLEMPSGRLPFSSWAPLCGFTQIRTLPNANPPVYELASELGTLTLVMGQRFAKWNGTPIGLGFPLVAEKGEVVAHSIDVSKSFYPLGIGTLTIPKKRRVLVLDPGHGGADPGSQATVRKAMEKDLALDWALRIERMLAQSSWQVVLTRRDDRDVSLADRIAFSDTRQGDLFISLHFNALGASANGKAPDESGIETYCLTPAGAPSNVTRNFEDDLRRVYPNNEYDAQNLLLACRLQAGLVSATGRRDRGVRRARFMTVVREQRRPAVLVEGGFLSNPLEADLILQPDYRERMARAVCNALPD